MLLAKSRSLLRANRYVLVCVASILFVTVNFLFVMRTYTLDEEFIELDVLNDSDLSFKERYLKTLKDPQTNLVSYSDSSMVYDKLRILDFVDTLINEPINEFSISLTRDPYELILKSETDFIGLQPAEKAQFYTNIVRDCKWRFRPIQEKIYRDQYDHQRYLDIRIAKWSKIKEIISEADYKALGLDEKDFETAILNNKKLKIEHNKKSIDEIQNSLKHLRLFNNIYLDGDESDSLDEQCSQMTDVQFPWMSGILPAASRWDKKSSHLVDLYPVDRKCIVKKIRANLKGRGIVISTNDRLVNELSGLIALLRVLGNEYPIQIFHSDDLSVQSQKQLNKIATDTVINLPKSYSTVKGKFNSKIPKQDITFVDVSRVVDIRYKEYFKHWSNKLLAYQFNTFEEMMMLDTDTVPLLPPEDYFKMKNYKSAGASFFRDREANNFLFPEVVDFFKQFLTTDKDFEVLQLPLPTEALTRNRFFHDRARHFMEAGLFCINRRQHFNGILGSLQLNFFSFVMETVHGEKELIWMGPQFMGDNNYLFNLNPAVAVGELTSDEFLESKKSQELCSTHPGHLSDEDSKTVVWFNSGFSTCKKPEAYFKDIHFERNSKLQLKELKNNYIAPLKVKAVIKPPPGEYEVPNLEDHYEPSRGWIMTTQCENYMWCAYDHLGGGTMDDDVPRGVVHEYTAEQTQLWGFYGEVWVDYFNLGSTMDEDFYLDEDDYDEVSGGNRLLSSEGGSVGLPKGVNPQINPKPVNPHTKNGKSKGLVSSDSLVKDPKSASDGDATRSDDGDDDELTALTNKIKDKMESNVESSAESEELVEDTEEGPLKKAKAKAKTGGKTEGKTEEGGKVSDTEAQKKPKDPSKNVEDLSGFTEDSPEEVNEKMVKEVLGEAPKEA
ncbi:unnamed protein product [Kuraishia capsulata CBS 1993]|uniref:Glycosyltransferase family 71 protein n=1 Tax=Kuraishia capsulata CBS 1993 TaxID=1382522 RepID=W6MXW7_9ASCO|nr:uncharacterized protein KUCA_T00005598001 [Kuraishia capsulata CBS 1993]CDK29605.1 unnamed protein product [Kuraishia capsulata CBS 1993]